MPDGSIEERTITTVVGAVITVSTAYSTTPNVGSVWMLQNTDVEATTWRVLTVTENEGAEYQITALAHNPSKYAYVEQNRPLQNPNISVTEISPEIPVGINYEEVFYATNNRATSKIVVRWQPVRGVSEYRVQWKRGDGNWNLVDTVSAQYEILEADIDTYYIRVYSLNPLRIPSTDYAELTVTTVGKTALPANVIGESLIPINESSAILSWTRSSELDVLVGGKVLIRHSKATENATWGESQEIVAAAGGSQTQKQVPLLNGSYLLKFEDDGGRRSVDATVITADLTIQQPRLTISNVNEEDSNFAGTGSSAVNMNYNAGYDALIITELSLLYVVDGYVESGYFVGLTGEFNLGLNNNNPLDLGATYDVNIQRRIASAGYSAITLWDSQTALIDTWETIDGDVVDRVDVAMYVRYATEDPASSPVWSSWREFSNAIVRGRGFQFKIIASSEDVAQNIQISQLGVLVELQQRVEVSAILTTGAAAYNVTYTKAFYAAPSVLITPYDLLYNEDYTITSVTRTGFTVAFKQGASFIARSFTYTAVGYGGVI